MYKKLYRSRKSRTISGVCGGLEDYFNIDVTIIRLIWVVVTIASGGFPGILAYVLAAFIIPEEPLDGSGNNNSNRDFSNVEYKVENDEDKE